MKKINTLASAILAVALVFGLSACSDLFSTTADSVSPKSLESSGATSDITSGTELAAFMADVAISGTSDVLSSAASSVGISSSISIADNARALAEAISRSVTLSEAGNDVTAIAEELEGYVEDFYSAYVNGKKYEQKFNISKNWGEVETKIDGLTVKVPSIDISGKVALTSDKILTAKLSSDVKASVLVDVPTFLESSSDIKTVATNAAYDVTVKVKNYDLTSGDVPDSCSWDGTVTFGYGISGVDSEGLGGKVVAYVKLSSKGDQDSISKIESIVESDDYTDEELATAIDDVIGVDVELVCYNDNNKKTYTKSFDSYSELLSFFSEE